MTTDALFDQVVVDKARLTGWIRQALQEKSQVSLPELVERHPLDTHLNKVVELGFVRRLKPQGSAQQPMFEVRRILKAFVDAQWLNEFDQRLGAYRAQLGGGGGGEAAAD